MNNNMMMLLPLLMNMNKSGDSGINMTDMMMNMLKTQQSGGQQNSAGLNPMALMLLSMMNGKNNNQTANNAPTEKQNGEAPKKNSEPNFDAIKNFSGNDVMETLKILMENR